MMIPVPIPPEISKPLFDEAVLLIKTFLGSASKEIGEIGGDYVRFFRFERQVHCLRKAHQILKDKGITPKSVNMRVLFPLLEAASFEDEEAMSERWASLLASAANPNNQSALEASFIEILKQLAPSHAYLLDVFYEQVFRDKIRVEEWNERGYVLSDLKGFLENEVPEFEVAVENLLRLNLVAHPTFKLGIANGREIRIPVTSGNLLCATSLGFAFASACGNGQARNSSYGIPRNSIANVFWTRGGSPHITPAPPSKALPHGNITPELKLQVEMEALAIALKTGFVEPGVCLVGKALMVFLGKKKMPQEAIFPLVEFCAERDLQLHTHQNL